MKISVCIPQYNRIEYLLKNLGIIALQTYNNIEVVISDDASTDNTKEEIEKLQKNYRYPLIYNRSETNSGYDRNLRKSLELASGEYCFILGNDDSFNSNTDVAYLAGFLKENDYPDIGFCNYVEEKNRTVVYERAPHTGVLGNDMHVILKNYRSFSYVAGVIIKRERFLAVNTSKFDRSVYVQIYLAVMMQLNNGRLFTIKRPLVLKDIIIPGKKVDSYRDFIARKWKNFKVTDAALPRVMGVAVAAFEDKGYANIAPIAYKFFRGIYSISYPHWIVDYRKNSAFVAACGLVVGMYPNRNPQFYKLTWFSRTKIYFLYFSFTFLAVLTPVNLFYRLKPALYKYIKR